MIYRPNFDIQLIKRRLSSRIMVDSNTSCWLWQGSKNSQGYGTVRHRGEVLYVHRATYELYIGTILPGLIVMHTCDVRNCINPDHLMLGTYKDNSKDAVTKGRVACAFTREQAKDVKDLISSKAITQTALASRLGVSVSCINNIVRGKSYL